MKKIISIIISALTAFSASSLTTFAARSFDYSDDSITHKTRTRIVGDLNEDGEINVGDLVIMTHFMHGNTSDDSGRYYNDETGYSDLNFDLTTDIFDLVELRKLVISPEKAFKIVSDVEILSSADKTTDTAAFIRSPEDIASYLSGIGTSEEEIQKYLDIYDDNFFKDSDVIFDTLAQKYGSGVHFSPPAGMFLHGKFFDILESEKAAEYFNLDIETIKNSTFFSLLTSQEYNEHPMLYPQKDSVVLFQMTVPKNFYDLSNVISYVWDFELFTPEYAAHRFDSPDGKHQLYIPVTIDDFMDDGCTYMFFCTASDGSLEYYREYYDFDRKDKFSCDYTPKNNNTIYYFGDKARIIWLDFCAEIEFNVEKWNADFTECTKVWETIAELRYV
ncbi:MAG: hypothetical protein K6G33_03220 [Ruminococcus sp.]|uniref:dockerin type I domain-containing protein n=1 Tax=Ruminococcus sp. TaxID=41978 RepID=UPI0025F76E0A|nr:dockerin type I domain-containing protein [Ruminococcus sp.]MCR5599740.1 hypothetical protein [Ruminococcus sp.]